MEPTVRQLVQDFWDAANARDWARFGALLAPAVIYEVPQTRERVRGRDNYVEFNRTWPGDWVADLRQLIADAESAVSVIDFRVDGEVMTGISVFTVERGLIAHITDHWPSPYEPPPRQVSFIERW